jgi:hypothetical protein
MTAKGLKSPSKGCNQEGHDLERNRGKRSANFFEVSWQRLEFFLVAIHQTPYAGWASLMERVGRFC